MLAKGTVLNNSWRIESFLGEGACAKVYVVNPTGKSINYNVVAKVIPTGNGTKSKKDKEQEKLANTLYYEYVLLTGLLAEFPYRAELPTKFYGVDEEKKLRYLVMERFEYDLKHLSQQASITPAKVADIGLQILKGLQWLHQKGFIFVDVKPDNFMMKSNKAYFVDFGLVERIGVTPPGQARDFAGTPTYCSLNLNRGGEPSPADDVEGLGYVLLSLFNRGELPWEHSSSDQELLAIKTNTNIKDFATSLGCAELGNFIEAARNGLNYALAERYLNDLATRPATTQRPKTRRSSADRALQSPLKEQPKKREKKEKPDHKPPTTEAKATKRQKIGHPAPEPPAEVMEKEDDETVEVAASLQEKVSLKQTKKLPAKKKVIALEEVDEEEKEKEETVPAKSIFRQETTRISEKSEQPIEREENEKKENIPNLFTSPRRKMKTPFSSSQPMKSSSIMHHLRVISGPHTNSTFNVDQLFDNLPDSALSLGRDDDNNIVFDNDFTVSSKHLSMKRTEEGFFIKDNGSTNKTRINNERIYSRRYSTHCDTHFLSSSNFY